MNDAYETQQYLMCWALEKVRKNISIQKYGTVIILLEK